MKRMVLAAAVAAFSLAAPIGGQISAQAQMFEYGFAGLLDKANRTDLEPITLASGKPLAEKPYELRAGGYYRISIVADGSAELAIHGPDFFRNVWVNEIVINDIEVRPLGVDSLEFDDEGEAEISFVVIRPGTFALRIPGTTGESQQAVFNVK